MRGLRSARLVVAAALVAAGVVSFAPANAASGYAGFVNEHSYVHTAYGDIYVQYWRPTHGKAPVLLSMSPYRYVYGRVDATGSQQPITDVYSDRYTKLGIGRAYADVLGTGDSTGCWDYGGSAEAAAGAAVVEWLGTRPWSTGKVAMIGTSYDGAIQLEIATLAPKHLAAIVPQEPVASWYHYNYDHGVLWNSSEESTSTADQTGYPVGTPDLFDLVLGRTPPLDPDRSPQQHVSDVADKTSECQSVDHNYRGHGADPSYDDFWKERDWALRAGNVKAAVLFQHGWIDDNTKPHQFSRYFRALTHTAEKRALLGQWVHTDVFDSTPAGVHFPIDQRAYLTAFLQRWLQGAPAAVEKDFPAVLSESQDAAWHTSWPTDAAPRAYRLPAQGATIVNTGAESSASFRRGPLSSTPNVWIAKLAPVSKDTRLVGTPQVRVVASSTSIRGQLDATLLDVAPSGTATLITLGMLDLRYRSNPTLPQSLTPGASFAATVEMRPQDWVLKAGHQLALALAGSESVWGVPDPVTGQVLTLQSVVLAQAQR